MIHGQLAQVRQLHHAAHGDDGLLSPVPFNVVLPSSCAPHRPQSEGNWSITPLGAKPGRLYPL